MDKENFVRGNSTNLPNINSCMIIEYMSSSDKHNIAEIRGAKALLSSRDSYVDTAVGYVEINRTSARCVVRAKVVPEHKVSTKQYVVTVTLNENENNITQTTCDSCAASAGGCKHTLVLLFWLEKRSNEPASTSVQCYWLKPRLSGIKQEPIISEEVFKNSKKIKLSPKDPQVLKEFIFQCKKQNVLDSVLVQLKSTPRSYNLFDLTVEYLSKEPEDYNNYIQFLNCEITQHVIKNIAEKTKHQVDSKLWHYIRQGRITASKIHEASRCTTDGTLVKQILGGYKVPETVHIKRGKKLEQQVLKEAEKQLKKKFHKSGFILINAIVGASPDGIGDDFIIEIKCPSTEVTKKIYIKNGNINPKYTAQMQTQMLAANKLRGIFCVADPLFEANNKIYLTEVKYDEKYMQGLMENSMIFWKSFIYKKLIQSAMT